jgi:hypothetical protein
MSLNCFLYNSEDQVSLSLDGENIDFGTTALMEPDTLLISSSGKSIESNCSYSYSFGFDGVALDTGAESNAGNLSWHSRAGSNSWHDGSRAFSLSNRHDVEDGFLRSYSSNQDHRIEEEIETKGARYSESAKIAANSFKLSGKGESVIPTFSYSYAQTFDGDSLGFETESSAGGSKWTIRLDPDKAGDEIDSPIFMARNFAENGSMKSSFFNDNNRIDESIETDNSYYIENVNITPDDLAFLGKGTHRQSAFLYSYSQTLDGETLGSRANSTSGGAFWSSSANASSTDGSKDALLIAKDFVENGSLNSEYYNSEYSVVKSVETLGAYFSERAEITPVELNARGSGINHLPTFMYSYSQTFDGDTLGSRVDSTSGGAFWSSSMNASSTHGSKDSMLTAKDFVENGTLNSEYYNPDHRIEERVKTDGVYYSERAEIAPGDINAKGSGINRIAVFAYSYSQILDGDTIGSKVDSTSGGAFWSSSANASSADGPKDSMLKAKDFVENGSLSSEYYNSEYMVAKNVETKGAYYSESGDIAPDNLTFKGTGFSRKPEFGYSYSQTFDGDTLGSRVDSTSGGAFWSASANASSADGSKDSMLKAKDFVENGSLSSEYYNSEDIVAKSVATE